MAGPGKRIGTRVGDYVLERALGEGGMGAVFAGRQAKSDLVRAIKLLTGARDATSRERFAREARALVRVGKHPAIVTIHDVGETEAGEPFLVLDLIEGPSLEQRLQAGPLPVPVALRIARDVADALAFVHARGITHRDLKPGNVLLREDGGAVLGDFGIVRDEAESRLTASRALIGTPAFMSPEQIMPEAGVSVGPPSDVFALGALLHVMLSGQSPFEGESLVEVVHRITAAPIEPPGCARRDVPPDLDALILWCLARPRAERPDAARVAAALRAIEAGRPAQLPASSRPRRPALPSPLAFAAAAGSGALVVLIGAAAFTLRPRAAPAPAPAAAPPPAIAPASAAAAPASPIGWRLRAGDRVAWTLEIDHLDSYHGHMELRLDLAATVTSVNEGVATLEATFEWIRMDWSMDVGSSGVALQFDSRTGLRSHEEVDVLDAFTRAPWRVELDLGTGEVRAVTGLDARAKAGLAALSTSPRATDGPRITAIALDELTDHGTRMQLERLLHALPPPPVPQDGGRARFTLEREEGLSGYMGVQPVPLALVFEAERVADGAKITWSGGGSAEPPRGERIRLGPTGDPLPGGRATATVEGRARYVAGRLQSSECTQRHGTQATFATRTSKLVATTPGAR